MAKTGDMPYTIEKEDDGKWCIYDKATGKKVKGGEFNDRMSAMNKVRELLKIEAKEPTVDLEDGEDEE